MKVKRFNEHSEHKTKKKLGIGSLTPSYKHKKHNDREHLEMLRKKLELQDTFKEKDEERKDRKEKENEPEYKEAGPVKKILKRAGDFIAGEVAKKYVPPTYYN